LHGRRCRFDPRPADQDGSRFARGAVLPARVVADLLLADTHRVANSYAHSPTLGSLAKPPYHPHIRHANLGITSIYLQGIDSAEIVDTVHGRPSPVISASAGLQIAR
jgi:hypothetical protein